MRIAQLEYIVAVEKYSSINAAANQLLVSQSLLSSSVKALEEELGQPLFLRSNKGVRPTDFGKEFLPYARSVITQINQMKNLASTKMPSANSLKICSNGFRFAVDLVAQIYSMHRETFSNILIKDCSRQEIIDMLSSNSAEVGIARIWSFQMNVMTKQLMTKNVSFFPCTVRPAAIIVGPGSPLFHHPKNTISPKELAGYPYLICDYAQYNPNSKIIDQIPGLNPKQFLFTSNLSAASDLMAHCEAYMITADSASEDRQLGTFGNCRILELENCTIFAQIGWMKNRQTELSALAQEYVDMVSGYLQSR